MSLKGDPGDQIMSVKTRFYDIRSVLEKVGLYISMLRNIRSEKNTKPDVTLTTLYVAGVQ